MAVLTMSQEHVNSAPLTQSARLAIDLVPYIASLTPTQVGRKSITTIQRSSLLFCITSSTTGWTLTSPVAIDDIASFVLSSHLLPFLYSPVTMYASSVSSSEGISMSNKLRNMTHRLKPDIKIILKGSESYSTIMTYSTLDTIQGQVLITSPYNTRLKALNIDFIGP